MAVFCPPLQQSTTFRITKVKFLAFKTNHSKRGSRAAHENKRGNHRANTTMTFEHNAVVETYLQFLSSSPLLHDQRDSLSRFESRVSSAVHPLGSHPLLLEVFWSCAFAHVFTVVLCRASTRPAKIMLANGYMNTITRPAAGVKHRFPSLRVEYQRITARHAFLQSHRGSPTCLPSRFDRGTPFCS